MAGGLVLTCNDAKRCIARFRHAVIRSFADLSWLRGLIESSSDESKGFANYLDLYPDKARYGKISCYCG